VTEQLDLFTATTTHTWPEGHINWTGEPFLTQKVFREAELYAERYDEVYLWKDWPDRASRPDAGIDLVARQRDGGGWTAIQCKFYDPGHKVQRGDIDSFLTASGKEGFTERLIVSTTDWGKNAQEAIEGQAVPVQRVDVYSWDDLGLAFGDYEPAHVRRVTPHDARPHQVEANTAVSAGMAIGDRGPRGPPLARAWRPALPMAM
jgi:predicted helicase